MRRLLFFCMFALLFGPKVAGYIDTLSAFCVLIFIVALVSGSFRYLRLWAGVHVLGYVLFFLLIISQVSLVVISTNLTDYYQILRFGRAIVNVLGVAGVLALYFRFFGSGAPRIIITHVWLCIIAHGLLMITMFISPYINELVVDHIVVVNADSPNYADRKAGNRIAGLTSSWDATSAIQAIGILLIPLIYTAQRSSFRRILVLGTIPLSLAAMALSGLTGFVVLAVVGTTMALFWGGPRFKMRFLASSILVLGFIGMFLFYIAEINPQGLRDSSLARTSYMVFGDSVVDYSKASRAPTAAETIAKIFNNMYFLPESTQSLLVGLGGSGRSSNNYIIKADPGPTLNMHNLGVFTTFILYAAILSELFGILVRRKRNTQVTLFAGVILMTVLVVDMKVQYLLSRNSLSFMMIGLILYWQFVAAQRKRRENNGILHHA